MQPTNNVQQGGSEYLGNSAVPVLDLDFLSDTTATMLPATPQAPAAASADSVRRTSSSSLPEQGDTTAFERGLVVSSEDEKPVSKALVVLSNEDGKYTAIADDEGIYILRNVTPGTYALKVVRKGFALYERNGIAFVSGAAPYREIRLDRSVQKGQLVEARSGASNGSASSLFATRRSSAGVMEGVSAEQISKSADGDAGAVAKRISGTSVVGGKYIYVRGLGERYTNMTLNGLPVPSPEKDKRVVPQDLFPASALDRFVLYKTFSPDLYADFAGGSVALETKGIPDKRFVKVSVGTSGNIMQGGGRFFSTGKDRLTYDGGNTYWGFDDGTRALPHGVPTNIPIRLDTDIPRYKELGLPAPTRAERLEYAISFNNIYAIDTAKVLPNQNYSLSIGDVRALSGGGRMGYILSAGFKNKYEQNNSKQQILGVTPFKHTVDRIFVIGSDTLHFPVVESLHDTLPDGSTPEILHIGPGIERTLETGTYDATMTGLANFGWDINPEQHLFWRNFYVNLGSDKAARTVSKALPNTSLIQDRPVEERSLLEFRRRSLFSSQLGGGHYVGVGPVDSIAWVTGYSFTRGETPDSRKYLYSRENDSSSVYSNYNNDVWGTRIFEILNENALAGRMDFALSIPPEWSAREIFLTDGFLISNLRLPTAQTGVAGSRRNRSFDVTRYSYDKDKNIYDNQLLEDIRNPASLKVKIQNQIFNADFYTSPKSYDEYTANEGVYAGYFTMNSGFSLLRLPVDLNGGARMERYILNFQAPFTGDQYGDDIEQIKAHAIVIKKDRADWLPSVGVTTHPYADGKLNFQYAKTLTRPEIREIAPFSYYDYEYSRNIYGNPALRQTSVDHFDLRWESYFPAQQFVSASLFDKRFKDPIESVIDDENNVVYQNSKSARVYGVEFEGSLDIASIVGLTGWEPEALRGFSLYGNVAFMRSNVKLDTVDEAGQALAVTSKSRPMVGQSPYLWNLKFAHEIEWRRLDLLNAILYNATGKRVKDAGINGAPDVYEEPVPALEYLGKATLNKRLELAWSVKNLLNAITRKRGYENNQGKTYNTLTAQETAALYATVPKHYDTEVVRQGLFYEFKLTYSL